MTDEAAMEAVAQGETQQATILYERYKKRLYGYFRSLHCDREQSLDSVQQVFYRLLKYRQSYQTGHRFETWVFRLARNVYLDSYRKVRRTEPLEADYPEAVSEDAEREGLLQQALVYLPEDYQQVLVLSRYEQLTYEQIATVLDCSVGSVKMKVHRAIEKLRQIYFQVSEK
jgi:RNA polymerase sigma-70 factor (ECF subfamily)